MVLSFKLSSGAVYLLRFCRRAGHIYVERNVRFVGLDRMDCRFDGSSIVHHACRTQTHCPTMVSSFKLSSGTACLPRFCHFYQCSNAFGRKPQNSQPHRPNPNPLWFKTFSLFTKISTLPQDIDDLIFKSLYQTLLQPDPNPIPLLNTTIPHTWL